nr:hypothetical protein BdHM001_11560 [Bdellovibrio sp. HM001]
MKAHVASFQQFLRPLITGLFAAAAVLLSTPAALADCASPAAVAGAMDYFTATAEVKYCNGTNWVSTKYGGIKGVAALLDTDSSRLNASKIAVFGNYAYFGGSSQSGNVYIAVYNISDLANPTFAGSYEGPAGAVESLTTDGSYLYATNASTLRVLSISNPVAPTLVGSLNNTYLSTSQLVVSGNYVYAISSRLAIVDVSTKATPVLTSSLSHASFNYSSGLAVSGNYAYVIGNSTRNLIIVDITNKSAPSVTGSVNCSSCSSPKSIALYGNYAYIGNTGGSSSEPSVINITNKAAPAQVGTISNVYWINDIVVKGNYAYAASDAGDFYSLDLTNPTNPTVLQKIIVTSYMKGLSKISYDGNKLVGVASSSGFIATLDLTPVGMPKPPESFKVFSGDSTYSQELHMAGNTVVTMDSSGGLWTYNVSDPAAMSFYGRAKVPVSSNLFFTAAYFDGSYFYIAGPNQSSIFIYDLITPSAPTLVAAYYHSSLSQVMALTRVGSYIYAASSSGLVVLNATTITAPTYVTTVSPTFSWPKEVLASGSYLYVIESSYLKIFDISSPAAPTLVGTLNDISNLSSARDIAVSGNYAYIITGSALVIVDITTKSAPSYVAKTTSVNYADKVAISGNYAYTTGQQTNIVDISNPNAPVLKSSIYCGNCAGIAVSGSTAFVTDNGIPGIRSYNISNPLAIAQLSTIATPADYESIQRIAIKGNYALTGSSRTTSITVTETTNATNPTIVATLKDSKLAALGDLVISGNYAYTAASGHFTVIDVTNPATPSITGFLSHATNLASGRRVAVAGNYAYYLSSNRLSVIDITTKSAPVIAGMLTHANLSDCRGLALTGTYAVTLCASTKLLVIIDISNPAAPIIAGTTSAGSYTDANTVVISGNHAFINDSKVKVFDITNKTAPLLKISFDGIAGCSGCVPAEMHIIGSNLYTVESKITVWDISNPLAPEQLGSPINTSTNSYLSRVSFSANRLIASDSNDTFYLFEIISLPAPQKPVSVVSLAPRLRGASAVKTVGSTAFVLASGQLTVVDISNPESPAITSSWSHPRLFGATRLEISGNHAYIGEVPSYGISILDISNPSSPQFLVKKFSSFSNFWGVSNLAVQGGHLFVVGNSKLSAVSLSDLNNIDIVGSVSGAVQGLSISGNYAYSCNGSALSIIDISNPVGLSLTSFSDPSLNTCKDVEVVGNRAYVITTTNKSLVILDISTPTSPSVLGSITHATRLSDLTSLEVSGNYAYAVSGTGDLTLIDISVPANPAINDYYDTSGYTTQGLLIPPYLYSPEQSGHAFEVVKALPLVTQGACTVAGVIDYIVPNNVYAYCNGSVLIPMGPSPGAGGAGCATPTALAGAFNYNSTSNKMTYCDGSTWISME